MPDLDGGPALFFTPFFSPLLLLIIILIVILPATDRGLRLGVRLRLGRSSGAQSFPTQNCQNSNRSASQLFPISAFQKNISSERLNRFEPRAIK